MRRIVFSVTAALLSGAWLLAQQAPTFRSRTDLVVVDFQAMIADGTPIPDLKKEELTLKVGGKVREIKSLDFVKLADVDVRAVAPATKGSPKPTLPAQPFGSNLQSDAGRSIFLIIDDESMLQGQERQARDAAERFITALPARDRVALMTVPYQSVTIDLTTSRPRVIDALRHVTGHLAAPVAHLGGAADTTGCLPPSLVTFDVLKKLFENLVNISGPKTVVMISGGVRVEREIDGTSHCQWPTLPQLHELGVLAGRARIQLSFLQPSAESSSAQMGSTTANDTLQGAVQTLTEGAEDLVGATGGELFKVSAAGDPVFQKVARASSAYYLLTFDPDPDEQDGKTHKVSLSVSRSGVDLRARPEFEIENPAKPTKTSAPAKATTPEGVLLDRRTYDDLPMFATAYVVRASDRSKLKVVAIADAQGVGAPLDAAVFGLIDAKDKMVARWSADAKELARRPVSSATLVAPGEYRLRVGARDASGRLGAADFEFSAKLTKAGNFDLSDLLVGVSREDAFIPKFLYTNEPAALGYLEFYKVDSGVREPTISFELAKAADGPSLVQAASRIIPTKDADRFVATGLLKIDTLPPGDYIVRAVVRQGDKIVGTVLRTLRKAR